MLFWLYTSFLAGIHCTLNIFLPPLLIFFSPPSFKFLPLEIFEFSFHLIRACINLYGHMKSRNHIVCTIFKLFKSLKLRLLSQFMRRVFTHCGEIPEANYLKEKGLFQLTFLECSLKDNKKWEFKV